MGVFVAAVVTKTDEGCLKQLSFLSDFHLDGDSVTLFCSVVQCFPHTVPVQHHRGEFGSLWERVVCLDEGCRFHVSTLLRFVSVLKLLQKVGVSATNAVVGIVSAVFHQSVELFPASEHGGSAGVGTTIAMSAVGLMTGRAMSLDSIGVCHSGTRETEAIREKKCDDEEECLEHVRCSAFGVVSC